MELEKITYNNDKYLKIYYKIRVHLIVNQVKSYILTPSARDHLYRSESAVCRCQILTYEDGPRTERIKIFPMVVDP